MTAVAATPARRIPVTGVNAVGVAGVGVAIAAGGAFLIFATRRRRIADSEA
jgi:hypothetical protein